jgi:hypothetical protein
VIRSRYLLSTIAVLLAATAAPVAPAAASTTQEALFQDDAQMKSDPAGTLAILRSLGVARVRVTVAWYSLAPNANSLRKPKRFHARNPASYSAARWAPYDAIAEDAAADGIGVDYMLTGPGPLWATGRGLPSGTPAAWKGGWEPNAREFGLFAQAVGKRYGGSYKPRGASRPLPRVNFWSIWNEPNYGPDLSPQSQLNDIVELSPMEYRGLLDAGWRGLAASGHHPRSDTILIGETAPRGLDHPIGNFSGLKPLRFLRALYCVNSSYHQLRGAAAKARGCPTTAAGSRRFKGQHPALFNASGFSDHPYEQDTPPNQPTTSNPSRFKSDPDYADLPEIARLARTLDRLQRVYGSHKRFPIWSTEYGYRTRPPDPHIGVSPKTGAYYINWAEYLSYKQPRLASYAQYLLVDPRTGSFLSGLELANGTKLPGYDAYRMPLFLPRTSGHRGSRLEVWGGVRPAHFAQLDTGHAQHVQIQLQPGSRGAFTTIATVPITNVRGYFDVREVFQGSGTVRLQWSYPSGQTVHSRSVSVSLR